MENIKFENHNKEELTIINPSWTKDNYTYQELNSFNEIYDYLLMSIKTSKYIRIVSEKLDFFFDDDNLTEVFKEFLLQNHRFKIDILLKDDKQAIQNADKFAFLARKLSSQVSIKLINANRRNPFENEFIIFDEEHFIEYDDKPKAKSLIDLSKTKELIKDFIELSEHSSLSLEFREMII